MQPVFRLPLAALAALLVVFARPGAEALAEPLFEGSYAKFVTASPPTEVPEISFYDSEGAEHTLSEYRGRVVLVNFWATWCLACIVEMPELGRLQAELGGDDFTVLTLSQDTAGAAVVRRFLESRGLDNLPLLFDKNRKLGLAFDQSLLPTSVLIDAEGREVGRLVGPAEWSSPRAMALIGRFTRGK